MSRYVAEYNVNKSDDLIKFIAEDFLTKEGFQQTVYKGENVWKKGIGAVTAPQFIKLEYGQGKVHLEAWIKSFGEHGLTGFYGALPKSELNSRVQNLVRLLTQEIPDAASVQSPSTMGGTAQPIPAPVPVAVHNPTSKATVSIITGILSIIASLYIPLAGVILGIIGISTGKVGKQSTAKGLATAGFITGIIGLVLGIVIWVLNFVLSFMLLTS